jgi:CO/xanthine dehydrogenase Mo-binding subunit
LVLTREEDFLITSKRHPERMHYTMGAHRDGTLVAARIEIFGDAGAYATLTPVVMFRSTIHAAGPYRIPHVKVDTCGVYTNNPPSGAFRGFGAPQVCFASEALIDQLAQEISLDPLELRLKNALEQGDETATDQKLIYPVGLKETLRQAAAEFGSAGDGTDASLPAYPKVRGTGMAAVHYGCSLGSKGWYTDKAGAYVQICQDGSITVAIGHTEIGQGTLTVLTQIAAEALGLPLEQIRILEVDTGLVPDSGPTVASRATVFSGNAILGAIDKLKEQISTVACHFLDCRPAHLVFKNGKVFDKRRPETGVEFNKLIRECFRQNINLAAEGWFVAPKLKFDEETGLGEAYYDYSYGCNIAEVEVDLATGQVKVLRVVAAYDVGTPIHVRAIEGQVEGGVVQAMGWALYENYVMEDGRTLTPELTAYTVPLAMDIPKIKTILVPGYSPSGPFGAKSIGEPAIILGAAAIANAVSAACGVRITELPIRPESLLQLLRQP